MTRKEKLARQKRQKLITGLAVALVVLLTLLLVWIAAGPKLVDQGMRSLYPREYRSIVEKKAKEFDLEPALVYGVIRTESGFDPQAQSKAGACGLMQLTPETFDWVLEFSPTENPGDIYDPETNIHAGCALLRKLLDHYGDENLAICAYNAGMGSVSSWLEDERYSPDGSSLTAIPFPETERYLEKVLDAAQVYRDLY